MKHLMRFQSENAVLRFNSSVKSGRGSSTFTRKTIKVFQKGIRDEV